MGFAFFVLFTALGPVPVRPHPRLEEMVAVVGEDAEAKPGYRAHAANLTL